MKCDELLKLLNEYVDGEIDPAFCKEFEQHLAGCDPCKIVVDTIRKTILIYKNDQIYELPVEFRERLHKLLRQRWREIRDSKVEQPQQPSPAPRANNQN